MTEPIRPEEIRAELGLSEPPFLLNHFREYLGVRFVLESGVRSGGVTTWRPDGVTVALPPGNVVQSREAGSHELGHVANGDLGPHRPVLYRRGSGRGAVLNPQVEDRATAWGIDALIGAGPLRIALNHEQVKWVGGLAEKFVVAPRFLMQAAARYGLEPLVLQDARAYAEYLQSPAWIRRSADILAGRPFCERPLCGGAAAIVNHCRYDTLGDERPNDVEALCVRCYAEIHQGPEVTTPQLNLF